MDHVSHTQEKIARRSIEEDRLARPVTYLSKTEKRVLKEVAEGAFEHSDGVEHSSIEAAALRSLESWGLVSLRATKGGISGILSDKGRLLLHENPKLKFISDEKKWKSMRRLQILAILTAAIGVITTIILNR